MSTPVSRRAFLGGGAAVLLAGGAVAYGLAAGAGERTAPLSPPLSPPPAPRVRTVWRDHADGPMPARGDEGVPFVLRAAGPVGGPVVRGGALDAELGDQRAASYVNQDLGTAVHRVGARFAFVPGPGTSDDGSLCLAAWRGALPPDGPGVIEAPVHLVVTPRRWIHSIAVENELVELATGAFDRPLPTDGSALRVDVTLAGDRAEIALPDGTTTTVRDDRVPALPAPVACWESYRHAPGGAAVRLYETWAA
ncbi:hypothetical protein GCM10023200_51380 [Actinomycetospora chlora]|uniref:Uncharacterized protein n=1 Tax=Actinomycetospora chlora TaxID=663608 RepID=A0ABP9CAH3_9PSEU